MNITITLTPKDAEVLLDILKNEMEQPISGQRYDKVRELAMYIELKMEQTKGE